MNSRTVSAYPEMGPGLMVDVTFVETMTFPVEVVLPLRLIIYNHNVRRALITGQETQLPRPLAEWLAQESPLKGRVYLA